MPTTKIKGPATAFVQNRLSLYLLQTDATDDLNNGAAENRVNWTEGQLGPGAQRDAIQSRLALNTTGYYDVRFSITLELSITNVLYQPKIWLREQTGKMYGVPVYGKGAINLTRFTVTGGFRALLDGGTWYELVLDRESPLYLGEARLVPGASQLSLLYLGPSN